MSSLFITPLPHFFLPGDLFLFLLAPEILMFLLVWSERCTSVQGGIQKTLIEEIIVFASILIIAVPLYWTFYAHLLNRHS